MYICTMKLSHLSITICLPFLDLFTLHSYLSTYLFIYISTSTVLSIFLSIHLPAYQLSHLLEPCPPAPERQPHLEGFRLGGEWGNSRMGRIQKWSSIAILYHHFGIHIPYTTLSNNTYAILVSKCHLKHMVYCCFIFQTGKWKWSHFYTHYVQK